MSLVAANREVYALLKDGVKVSVPDRDRGGQKIARVRVVDWENPAANDFLLVSQMSITGTLYTRRPDLIGFINGLPMVVVEFKKPGVSARAAFDDNLTCYKADTDRQQEILDFIREQQQIRGMTPSTGEIQEQFGFASPNAVTSHLQALTRKGVLHREPNKARGLVLTDSYRDKAMIEIPIYGSIAAGLPEGQHQQADGCVAVDVETLRLPKGARVFALKVRGDSMNGAGILPGDIVVLEFKEAKHGDIVAALIDGETTLKRYVVQRGKPFLKAENPRFANLIPAQELVIQGVQIALLRVLKR
jgi:repressor LexA